MSRSLIDLLAASAARAPTAEAVVRGGERVSYDQLWRQVRSVAGFLRRWGLASGDRVALLLDNSVEYVAAYYGVLAAGGVVVGLNAAARARDLGNWIEHSGARLLVVQGSHPEWSELAGSITVPAVQVGEARQPLAAGLADWGELLATEPAEPLPTTADQLAALIYTSGTTGRPKGVMLSHGNLSSNCLAIVDYLGLAPSDRVMQVLPFYYSYGNSVLHTHLAASATLVLENSLVYPQKVLERMVAERCTGFAGVPSTFALLLNRTRLGDYDLSALRYLTQAGGAMAPSQIHRIRELLPQARFFVMYGQTEATARLSYLPPERLEEKPGSVGIAVPGTELEVQDQQGRPQPAGAVGEICARGGHVMLGYWQDPEASAEVLRGGWLHTGDLGYQDEEGYFYISGRATDMIKSGAHRISPKEIEEVILELDGVQEVAVVGVPDDVMGQLIKAVIVAAPAVDLAPMQIQAHCRRLLAAYKVPKFIELVAELPKTASGKIQRHRLVTADVGASA